MDFYMSGAARSQPPFVESRRSAALRLVFRRLRVRGARWVNGCSYPSVVAEHDRVRSEPD
jgi:hypothetical protein